MLKCLKHRIFMIPLEFRKIFCEDFKLPIKIYDSPLFEYYLNLYEYDLDISSKFKIFTDTMKEFKTPQTFSDEWHRIKNSIVADIDATPEFQEFVASPSYQSPFKVERGNVFNHKYSGSRVISIDLIEANFNSLKFFNPNIVFNCKNFEELVSRYSKLPYYSKVKIFRQVVFEKLHANRQQGIQRKMMDSILSDLFKIYPNLDLRMPSSDEIVIPLSGIQADFENTIKKIVSDHSLNNILRVEPYEMLHICDDYFYQKFDNGKIRLRNVPSPFYTSFLKKAKGLELSDEDLYFHFEGRLAKFIT